MEAFEQFVAVGLEAEGFVVSSAVKFDVSRVTRRASYTEVQRHGYEVDLVAARADRLVLATVKSFLGSRGVVAEHVLGTSSSVRANNLYLLLNNAEVRDGVVAGACERYGYRPEQVGVRLYVGRFAAPKTGAHEAIIREWCGRTVIGGGAIEVFGVAEVVRQARSAAASRQYRDNPVLVTMKVLQAAGLIEAVTPDGEAETGAT